MRVGRSESCLFFSQELFSDPDLFFACEGDATHVHPRLAGSNASYLDFAGRIVGLSIKFGMPIGIHLSHAAIRCMSARRVGAAELRELDVGLTQTCRNILEAEDVDAMGLVFATVGDGVELFSGSLALKVTKSNRAFFVDMLARRRLHSISASASTLLMRGVMHVIHSENVATAEVAIARLPPHAFNGLIGACNKKTFSNVRRAAFFLLAD